MTHRMNTSFAASLLILLVVAVAVGAASAAAAAATAATGLHRELPAFALSNFKDAVLTWANTRDNTNAGPVRAPGFTGLHAGPAAAMEASALAEDSFALAVDGKALAEPRLLSGDAWLTTDGAFVYEPYAYANESAAVGGALRLQRVAALPEGLHAYTVVYRLQNLRARDTLTVDLLDYVLSAPSATAAPATAVCEAPAACAYTLPAATGAGEWQLRSEATAPAGARVTFAAADAASSTRTPLAQFARTRALDNKAYASAPQVALGTAVSGLILAPGATVEVSFVRQFVPPNSNGVGDGDGDGVVGTLTSSEMLARTAAETRAWLARSGWRAPANGVKASKEDEFYAVALLAMRLSQNPVLGTYAASFHAAYQFKTWARDAVFSAMIMDTAGQHASAAQFLAWLADAPRRAEDGGFHTCYSWWTGAAVGFVEPQFDSAGAALMAYYYHHRLTGDTALLRRAQGLVRALEDFFLANHSGGAFVQPDYSIWEESSDGRTGRGLAPAHFAFTHALAHAGMRSAALIEERVYGDAARAAAARARSDALAETLDAHFWRETPDGSGYYVRSLDADTLAQDPRTDGSTAAAVFAGACTNATRAQAHVARIRARLTRLGAGIARYEDDPFFYDSIYSPGGREVGAAAPPWGVTTMFTAWAELAAWGADAAAPAVDAHLAWMVAHLYPHLMPVGEAVDGVSGEPVMSSSPDLYEHAGVFIWTYLLRHGKALLPNPSLW